MQSLKLLILTVASMAVSITLPPTAAAQFQAGQKYIGAHAGLSGVGSAVALGVNAEMAYNDKIGIGIVADTWSYGDSFSTILGNHSWDVRYTALAGTGAYHVTLKSYPKVDPFIGLALGYYIVSTESSGSLLGSYSGSTNRVFFGAHGGVRYFFKEKLTGVARLGVGASYLSVGLDYRM